MRPLPLTAALIVRGYAGDSSAAQDLLRAGRVRVNGEIPRNFDALIDDGDTLRVILINRPGLLASP